ncbi:D-inositol 3-phosphate glycosyltransferase [BD1-7 clade bacterium]|uniref:D-inositol 3-phosphate glycosyltransferase n=1 Tax=BD1-7 clade bacterium TaxID=2029982 RepID=A0A5S9QGR1_9GAMM|nr:D-inositol 3-phosphate glycosyltransferase [BD1-7 clade bacterium]CAA0117281.1 D-inositol 3-phosphate glycosyltransferase [BD1-7 clade bacterium]
MDRKMLRIGVDARPLAGPATGISRYVSELLKRLVQASSNEVCWYLYSDAPIDFDCGKASIVIRHFSSNRSGRFSNFFRYQYHFPRWIRKDSLDVFWGTRHHLPLLFPSSVRSVLTIHDLVWRQLPASMTRLGLLQESMCFPSSVNKADSLVCVSENTANDLLSLKPDTATPHVVCPGVSTSFFSVQSPANDQRYFLCTATLEPRKNLLRLLEAFASTRRRGCDWRLVIVGMEGWGDTHYSQATSRLNIESFVDFMGFVDDAELCRLYAGASAFVFPSLYEGFGLPIIEAMAAGVPVIASNVGSMPEVVGRAGYLVNPYDVSDIADAMLKLARDEALQRELKSAGLVRAKQFSWDHSAAALQRILLTGE